MRRIGDTFDAVTAFFGAALAGIALFLPITFAWTSETTPYRIASLYNSVPRGAAIGVVVAAASAVLVTTSARPLIAWLVALGGAVGMSVNHFAIRNVSSPDMLTTQNYIDAICGGLLLGALGAAVLRRPLPAFGFALGGVGFFVFGDFADVLHIKERDPWAVLETPPGWLIGIALALVFLSACRNRSLGVESRDPERTIDLPITPILAATLLALVVLAGSEWLARQYDRASESGSHTIEIAVVVGATVIAAMVAAMLLPGRDGAGLFLAVSLVPTADALGSAPRPGWSLLAVLVLTGIGVQVGSRLPATSLGIILIAGLSIFAIVTAPHDNGVLYSISSGGLAFTAGYCCGAVRPRYAPSGALAIAALYLPSAVSALPNQDGDLPMREGTTDPGTPGRTALLVTVGCAIGLAALHRFRPRSRPKPTEPTEPAAAAQ
ncbi:hypothetical protein [Nocardia sp. NPDC050710]|uniref:hypothetical protein n=1 Tax=Nocardia sp. NPDC050710 TaxID=3157220 RepID=UPI0033CC8921